MTGPTWIVPDPDVEAPINAARIRLSFPTC
jgi:hypothetical protein